MGLSVRLAGNSRRVAIATTAICLLCQRTQQVECFSGNSLNGGAATSATAVLVSGSHSKDEERQLLSALQSSGYARVLTEEESHSVHGGAVFVYELSRATGMLRLVSSPEVIEGNSNEFEAPRWIPMIRGEEKVLVENGWSFLDPDESEPMSAFDVDAANAEGQYRPKWGDSDDAVGSNSMQLSSLGYDIAPLPRDAILAEAKTLVACNEHSKGVLLDGQTDPPGCKMTSNGHDFRGAAGQADIPAGVFVCAIGGLPLFASTDLSHELSRATGMLRLVSSPEVIEGNSNEFEAPRWIPMIRGEEKVLVENGWSFLDPDESEPMSAFDVDAANAEGQYRPKWGDSDDAVGSNSMQLSSLGYDIAPLPRDAILAEAKTLVACNEHSKGVLLDGQTDPPGCKMTSNGHDFRGAAGQADIPAGVFVCAIGGLPLFASTDLSPMTGSSGWLTFTRPIGIDHVTHIEPDKESPDQRVEVIDARSFCHLGHYFGTDGYCINASALRFIPLENEDGDDNVPSASRPVSYRTLDYIENANGSPSTKLLKALLTKVVRYESVALGAGCFWHVEFALCCLPGVLATETAYAGGSTQSPTYRDVCNGNTGHAEVVKVIFDPDVLPYDVLFDCFLSMHDPTKVRSHGKHAEGIGQYRSCILCENPEIYQAALSALERCRQQLGKELSTDLRIIQQPTLDTSFGERWC